MKAIEIKNVSKSFRTSWGTKQLCINDFSLTIDKGTIVVLMGPNGSGKTTLIKMLLSLLHCDTGDITLLGDTIQSMNARQAVGYLPELPQFPSYLTAEEFLRFVCSFCDISKEEKEKRIKEVLDEVGLWLQRSVIIQKYSKGMKKRLGIAQAIITNPEVLILDEPLDGLDPRGVHIFSRLMKQMREKGKTIFMTTHLLNEIEDYADKIGIIQEGKIVFESDIESLRDKQSLAELYMQFIKT
ncbi:ABC transporter ATP-binding protein [Candidatus Omnitrophota bacterium]